MEDQLGDTLLYVPELSANIWRISNRNKLIEIGRLSLHNPTFQLRSDSTNTINIKYITDRLKTNKKKDGQGKMKIVIHNLDYIDGRFSLENKNKQKSRKRGIDFSDLKIHHVNIVAKRFLTKNNGVFFHVKEMSLQETTGFQVSDFESDIEILPDHLTFKNNDIITPESRIYSSIIDLNFNDYKDFEDFINKVKMFIEIEKSSIYLKDLDFFAPGIGPINEKVKFAGSLEGKVSNLHGRKINLEVGKETLIQGKADISGLPNLNETYWFLRFDQLNIQPDDISGIENIGKNAYKIHLPEYIHRLGLIKYTGMFTGFHNDFVSYGTVRTEIGELKTDISIKPNLNRSIKVTGNVEALGFNVGKLLQKEKLFGEMTMQLDVDGSVFTDHRLVGEMNGNISSFEFNNYDYQNIQLNGTFNNKSFDGSVNIDDPNIKFDFLGLVDLGKEIHEFDFSLVVPRANLSSLNLVPADTSSNLSFILTSSITGNNIENMNGNIKLINARYQSRGKEIEGYNFYLEANSNPDSSWLVLNTEYADISLTGNYKFNKIIPSIYFLQAKFLPSTLKNLHDTTGISKNDFHFNAHLKDLSKITDFFFPNIEIAPDSRITGTFNPSQKELILEGSTEYFYTKKNLFENPHFILASKEFKNLTFGFNAEDILINNKLEFSTFDLHSDFRNDSVFLGLSWFQEDSLLYKANINVTTSFSRDISTNSLLTNIYIPATTIVHKSIPWELNENSLQLDSSSINFNNFLLKSEEKSLSIDGMISKRPTDTLYLKTNNMMLKTQGLLQNKLNIEGIVNGEARISGLFDSTMFLSHLQFNDLKINEVPFGTGELNTYWDTETKSIKLLASTKIGTLKQFHAEGNYYNSSRSIVLDINLNKFKINSFLPFLSSVSGKLEGLASGKLEYSGKLNEPVINGKLNLQKASMTIDYLNTTYSFSAPVEIKNNIFHLNNIEVFDTLGNKALGNGRILTNHFKDLSFDLRFDTDNMLMLNLAEWQNDFFYGKVYGSGSILLNGSTNDLTLNISATTNTNTQFFIPLDKGKEFSDLNYINFVSNKPKEKPRERRRIKVVKKNSQTGNLKLNIELNITPDAEASVLFNPYAGGSLIGKGNGSIQMKVDKNSNFSMSGDYIIDQGTYNFSLSQVINKKFDVKQGSTIIWSGDPTDASLDVTAVYPVRTTLATLFEYEDNPEQYNRRVPVDCEVHLTGKLETPNIRFNISLPSSDEETKTKLNNVIDTEEKLNRQFLALLVMNKFISPQGGFSTNDALGTTGFELLSNQLSGWLSQISDDFDIGFHYRPGDNVSGQEIELALSTQILNDRVIINTGIGQEEVNNSNNIVGDVSVEVKIDKKGKFRAKAFTRPRTNEIPEEDTPYISGIGIFFREEFNSFGSLINSYWDRIFKNKKNKKKDK